MGNSELSKFGKPQIALSVKYSSETIKAWVGESQWRALRADFARFKENGRACWGSGSFWVLAIFRFQTIAERSEKLWLWLPARILLTVLKKLLTVFTHISIGVGAQIGPGLLLPDTGPLRIHRTAKIGADCVLQGTVTIGAGGDGNDGATIGDHVTIGCHSSVIGRVAIGDNGYIAPCSLVLSDIPAGAAAIGVPARLIPMKRPAGSRASELPILAEPARPSYMAVKAVALTAAQPFGVLGEAPKHSS